MGTIPVCGLVRCNERTIFYSRERRGHFKGLGDQCEKDGDQGKGRRISFNTTFGYRGKREKKAVFVLFKRSDSPVQKFNAPSLFTEFRGGRLEKLFATIPDRVVTWNFFMICLIWPFTVYSAMRMQFATSLFVIPFDKS